MRKTLQMIVVFVVAVGRLFAADDAEIIPREFGRLMKSGGVVVKFYPPAEPPVGHVGWTDFDLTLNSTYDYEFARTRTGREVDVDVRVKFKPAQIKLGHVVLLPASFQGAEGWKSSLLRHEFDHVAIATDPRVELLFNGMLGQITRFKFRERDRKPLINERIRQRIDEQVRHRREALYNLVRANNRQLDTATRHGTEALPDRSAFFRDLYGKDSLDAAKFPYLVEVIPTLESVEYRGAESGALR